MGVTAKSNFFKSKLDNIKYHQVKTDAAIISLNS
jgi:hypothetical protein